MTSQTAGVVMAAIWIVPGMLFVPWLFVYRQQTFDVVGFDYVACHVVWPSRDIDVAFTVGVVFIVCYLLPFAVIAVVYLLIGIKVGCGVICNAISLLMRLDLSGIPSPTALFNNSPGERD